MDDKEFNKKMAELLGGSGSDEIDVKVVGGGELPPGLISALGKALSGMTENEGLSREEQFNMLKDASIRYENSKTAHPFKVGDIIMPREDVKAREPNRIAIVVETVDPHYREVNFSSGDLNYSSSGYGPYLDTRVMTYMENSVACFWIESYTHRILTEDEIEKWKAGELDGGSDPA